MTYTVAIIGTGAKRDQPGRTGFGMAYRHAPAYQRLPDCELVACADIVRENALAFAETFDIKVENVFEDYEQMLRIVEPDIVSVCVPPRIHAPIVKGCAESGVVQAIHCEKPMGMNMAEVREMVEVCERNGVQLTINHQRRFAEPMVRAKALLDAGKIGDLTRIEMSEANLFDAGCHNIDLAGYFTDQSPVEWVLAAVDYQTENVWFGAHNANQVLSQWRYRNGVFGLAMTGEGAEMAGAYMRLIGTDGVIEIGGVNAPPLRLRNGTGDWQVIKTDESIHGPRRLGTLGVARERIKQFIPGTRPTERPSLYDKAIEDVVAALREKRTPLCSATYAMQAAEIVFASYESARRTARVSLPLDVDDNPLEAMVESGQLAPKAASAPQPAD